MAKKVKFPLKMADGSQVRTLEELREHFDLVSVLGYYDNGRLVEWLSDRYYEEEAEKINALDSSAGDFKKNLCEILAVTYQADETDDFDLTNISTKNERRERLKVFTADEKILAAVDSVAFTQEELADLLDDDVKVIYLCGERFEIPGSNDGVAYIGVNKPKDDAPDGYISKGIVFRDVELDLADIIRGAKEATDPVEAAKLWQIAAEQGNVEAQYELAYRLDDGTGVDENVEEAVKWYRKAAEQGYAESQWYLGLLYEYGTHGLEQSHEEAVKWYRMAAEQGNAKSQFNLGACYESGKGFEKNAEEAAKWYRKAAEQGYAMAQTNLGYCYERGWGVEENNEEAIKWLHKAMEQGDAGAKNALIELAPQIGQAI